MNARPVALNERREMKTSNIPPPPSLIDLWQWLIEPSRGGSEPLSPNVIHHSRREAQACLIIFNCESVICVWVCFCVFLCVQSAGEEEGTVVTDVAVIWSCNLGKQVGCLGTAEIGWCLWVWKSVWWKCFIFTCLNIELPLTEWYSFSRWQAPVSTHLV